MIYLPPHPDSKGGGMRRAIHSTLIVAIPLVLLATPILCSALCEIEGIKIDNGNIFLKIRNVSDREEVFRIYAESNGETFYYGEFLLSPLERREIIIGDTSYPEIKVRCVSQNGESREASFRIWGNQLPKILLLFSSLIISLFLHRRLMNKMTKLESHSTVGISSSLLSIQEHLFGLPLLPL